MSDSEGDFERNSEEGETKPSLPLPGPEPQAAPLPSPPAINTATVEAATVITPTPPQSQPLSPARPHITPTSETPLHPPISPLEANNQTKETDRPGASFSAPLPPSVSFQGIPVPPQFHDLSTTTASFPPNNKEDQILNEQQFREMFLKEIGGGKIGGGGGNASADRSATARSQSGINRSAVGPAARLRMATRENLRAMSPGALPSSATFIDPFRGSKFKNRIFLNSQGNGSLVLSGGRPTTASAAVLAGAVLRKQSDGYSGPNRSASAGFARPHGGGGVSLVTESQKWTPLRSGGEDRGIESSRGGLSPARGAGERALDRESALQVALVNLRHDMDVKERELTEMRVRTKQAQESMTRAESQMIRARPTEADAISGIMEHLRNKNAHQEAKIGVLEEQVYQLKQNTRAAKAGELQVQCTAYLAEIRRLGEVIANSKKSSNGKMKDRGGVSALAKALELEGGPSAATGETPLYFKHGDGLSTPLVENLVLALTNDSAIPSRGQSRTNSPQQQRPGTGQSEQHQQQASLRQKELQIESLHKRLLSAKEDYRLAEADGGKWKSLYTTEKPQMDEAVRRLELYKEFPNEVKRLQEEITAWKEKLSTATELLEKERAARALDQQAALEVVALRDSLAKQVTERDYKLQQQEEKFERRGKELDAELIVKVTAAVDAEKLVTKGRESELLKELGEWNTKVKDQEDFALRQKAEFESTVEKLRLKEENALSVLKNTMQTEEHEREAKLRKGFEEAEATIRKQLDYQRQETEIAAQKLSLSQQESDREKKRAQDLEVRLLATQTSMSEVVNDKASLTAKLEKANVDLANAKASEAAAHASAAATATAATRLQPTPPSNSNIPPYAIERHGSFQPPLGMIPDYKATANTLLHVEPPADHYSQRQVAALPSVPKPGAGAPPQQDSSMGDGASSTASVFTLADGSPASPLSPPQAQGTLNPPTSPPPRGDKSSTREPVKPAVAAPGLTTTKQHENFPPAQVQNMLTNNNSLRDDDGPRGGGFLAQSEMLISDRNNYATNGLPKLLGETQSNSVSINQTMVDVTALTQQQHQHAQKEAEALLANKKAATVDASGPIASISPPPTTTPSSAGSPYNAQSPHELGTTSKPAYSPVSEQVANSAAAMSPASVTGSTTAPLMSQPLAVPERGRYEPNSSSALNQMSGSIEDRRQSDGVSDGSSPPPQVQQPARLKAARPGVNRRGSPSTEDSPKLIEPLDQEDMAKTNDDSAVNRSHNNALNANELNTSAGTSVSSSVIQGRPMLPPGYTQSAQAHRAGSMRLIPGGDDSISGPSPLATYSAFSNEIANPSQGLDSTLNDDQMGAKNGEMSLQATAFGQLVESQMLTGSAMIPPTPMAQPATPSLNLNGGSPKDGGGVVGGSKPESGTTSGDTHTDSGTANNSARHGASASTAAPTPRLLPEPQHATVPLSVTVPQLATYGPMGSGGTSPPPTHTPTSSNGGDIPLPKPLPAHEMISLAGLNPMALAAAQQGLPHTLSGSNTAHQQAAPPLPLSRKDSEQSYPSIPKTHSLSVSTDDDAQHIRAAARQSHDSEASPFRNDTNTATYHNEPSPLRGDMSSNAQTPNFPNARSTNKVNTVAARPVMMTDSLTADLHTSADMISSTSALPSAAASMTGGTSPPTKVAASASPVAAVLEQQPTTLPPPALLSAAYATSPTSRSTSVPPSALKGSIVTASMEGALGIRKSVSFPVNPDIEVPNPHQWTESSASSSHTSGSSSNSSDDSSDTDGTSSNSSSPDKRPKPKEVDAPAKMVPNEGSVVAPKTAEEEL